MRIRIIEIMLVLGVMGGAGSFPSPSWATDTSFTTLQPSVTTNSLGTELVTTTAQSVLVDVTILGTARVVVETKGSAAGDGYKEIRCKNVSTELDPTIIDSTGIYKCLVSGSVSLRTPISNCAACTVTVRAIRNTGTVAEGLAGVALTALTGADTITASSYGLVGSSVADQTALLQSFLNLSINKTKVLDVSPIKYTTAMTVPASGIRLVGVGSGGEFNTYLIPTDCAAFLFTNGTHHIEMSNFMIWPQGTTPPTTIITLSNTYNVHLHDIRIHVASTYVPSTAVISLQNSGGGANVITFDNFTIRSDGNYFPVGFLFGADFGSVTISNSDVETSTSCFTHSGGHVTVVGTYTERCGTRGIFLNPTTDANASFTWLGGQIRSDNSGVPIRVDAGAKNTRIVGAYVSRTDLQYQGFVYSVTGISNLYFDLANQDPQQWGSSFVLDPTLIEFRGQALNRHETVTYSASMTPSYLPGTVHHTASITATNNTAFTVNVPSEALDKYVKPQAGGRMTVVIRNTSGVALGVATWAAGYKLGAAWTQPATAFSRSITFEYNGTNWVEATRAAADVAN